MTSDAWEKSNDPQRLLDFVRPRASRRRLQLFLCARLRRLEGEFFRELAVVLECVADGVMSSDVLTAMTEQRYEAHVRFIEAGDFESAAYNRDRTDHLKLALRPDDPARYLFAGDDDLPALLDLFRPSPPDRSLLTRDNHTIRLALAAYEERLGEGTLDPARLAVLADSLEECGYPAALLAHLRSPGPHFRGCFALDAVLGKS